MEAAAKAALGGAAMSGKDLEKQHAALAGELRKVLEAVGTAFQEPDEAAAPAETEETQDLTASLTPETAARLREAAELGDVAELQSIAEELISLSKALTPFRDKIHQMAADFDFEGSG